MDNSVPVAISTRVQTVQPIVSRSAKSMRIQHRELVLASIPGSVAFQNQFSLSINPGLSGTFPWLAPQAAQWEQYAVRKLIAQYVPIAPTSTQGDVIISPDYDASDPTPTTEAQAANAMDAVEDACWKRIDVVLDVPSMMGLGPRRYVRQGNVAGDVKTFDVAKLFVSTVNETGTSAIGKLYLDYDIEFFVPQNSPSPATAPDQTYMCKKSGAQTLTTGVSTAIAWEAALFDPLGFGNASSGVFTPAAGSYRIEVSGSFADSASEAFSGTLQIFKNGAAITQTGISAFSIPSAIGAACQQFLSTKAIVNCNGTDTVEARVTLTGAAGTLTTVAFSPILLAALA